MILWKISKADPPPLTASAVLGHFLGLGFGRMRVGTVTIDCARGLSCLWVARQPQLIYQPAVREWQLFCCVASLFIYISHCYRTFIY